MQEYLVWKSDFLCSICIQLGIKLFIARLCMYTDICRVSRSHSLSYDAVSWMVSNGQLWVQWYIFDFLTWFTIICRPLSLDMLAYWYGHLVYQRAMLFSGVFCLEEWMKSWEKLSSLSSFFPTLLSQLIVLLNGISQGHCFLWSLAVLFEMSYPLQLVIQWLSFWKGSFDVKIYVHLQLRMLEWRGNLWQCSVLHEDHCECIARQAV